MVVKASFMKNKIYVFAIIFLITISIILLLLSNRYSYEQLQHGSNECLIKTDSLIGSACSITDHPYCEDYYRLCPETSNYQKSNAELLIEELYDGL